MIQSNDEANSENRPLGFSLRAGVDEIAFLMDFGVPTERVLESLPFLNQIRQQANAGVMAGRKGGRFQGQSVVTGRPAQPAGVVQREEVVA